MILDETVWWSTYELISGLELGASETIIGGTWDMDPACCPMSRRLRRRT